MRFLEDCYSKDIKRDHCLCDKIACYLASLTISYMWLRDENPNVFSYLT